MPAIINPLDSPKSRILVRAGWRDIPHLDAEAKAEVLNETPEWLRDAREKGTPTLGIGAIYRIPEDRIKVDPFHIPDHWPRCYSLDVGWRWTAALWCAFDRDNGIKYLYGSYKAREQLPAIHAAAIKARGEWIPGLIDPSARNRSQKDGQTLFADYTGAGLHLTPADNAVEAGILKCWQALQLGETKVFSTLQDFFGEYREYQRDEKGKVVKKNDHLLDDMRYIHNSGANIATVKPVFGLGATTPAPDRGPGGY